MPMAKEEGKNTTSIEKELSSNSNNVGEGDEASAARIFQEASSVLELLSVGQAIDLDESVEVPRPITGPITGRPALNNFVAGFSSRFLFSPQEIDPMPQQTPSVTQEEGRGENREYKQQEEKERKNLDRIMKAVRRKEMELVKVYEIGKTRRRQYKQTENAHKKEKNAVARSLWMTRKNHRVNPLSGMKDYKNQMMRVSLPCHDTSSSVLNAEGKILKAKHGCMMLDRQMALAHEQQRSVINFFHGGVMNEATKDRKGVAAKLKDQVERSRKQRDALLEAYENVLKAQSKVLDKLQSEAMDDDDENLDAAASEAKNVEETFKNIRTSNLRESAEIRIGAKFGTLQERRARGEKRQKAFRATMKTVESIEHDSLQRAKKISDEIQNVMASLRVEVEQKDYEDGDDQTERKELNGIPEVVETKESYSSQASLDSSFADREEFEEESDSDVSQQNDGERLSHASTKSGRSGRRDKAHVSARLEYLRSKRRKQEELLSARLMSSRSLGATQKKAATRDDAQKSDRRANLLQRARSARSVRTANPRVDSSRSLDSRIAELRERRNNRAMPAPPIAEGP